MSHDYSEDAQFVASIMAHMHAETNAVTDSLIEGYKRRIAELEKENDKLQGRLHGISSRLDWIFWGGLPPGSEW